MPEYKRNQNDGCILFLFHVFPGMFIEHACMIMESFYSLNSIYAYNVNIDTYNIMFTLYR